MITAFIKEWIAQLCLAALREAQTRKQACTITVLDPQHRLFGRTLYFEADL